jgi:hypothetical protein
VMGALMETSLLFRVGVIDSSRQMRGQV